MLKTGKILHVLLYLRLAVQRGKTAFRSFLLFSETVEIKAIIVSQAGYSFKEKVAAFFEGLGLDINTLNNHSSVHQSVIFTHHILSKLECPGWYTK